MKLRSLSIGLALLTSGTIIGAATTQLATAQVSSGDKPILVPIEPCRLVDTRPGDATIGPRSSPLGTADTLTVDAQEAGTPCTGTIPTTALSLALNVTALNATQLSFLTIWAGGARPDASSLNPAPGQPPTPNAVTVDLSADQEFEVYNNLGSVNVLVDVTGYYIDHNHDDRYYTQAQSDAARPFTLSSARTTVAADGSIFDPIVTNSLDVAVPSAGQLLVTVTGNFSAVLDQGLNPSAQCSVSDDGGFDVGHRALFETHIESASPGDRAAAPLSITRLIEIDAPQTVELEVLCARDSGRVLVVSTIVAQVLPGG